jgi:hypothetical protein
MHRGPFFVLHLSEGPDLAEGPDLPRALFPPIGSRMMGVRRELPGCCCAAGPNHYKKRAVRVAHRPFEVIRCLCFSGNVLKETETTLINLHVIADCNGV